MVCLDGLSAFHASTWLGRYVPDFNPGIACNTVAMPHTPTASFHAVWSEILWGVNLFESGIAGYGRPRNDLNDVIPLEGDALPRDCALLSPVNKPIVVNLPLIGPAEGRSWLSDGSLPINANFNLPESINPAGFLSYRPRPFSCVAWAAGDIRRAIAECVDVERTRIRCASELLNRSDWRIGIVRLSIFDTLFHLLGKDFLQETDSVLAGQLEDFWRELGCWMADVRETFSEAFFLVGSTIGHGTCVARVNLSELLQGGGYCKLEDADYAGQDYSRRRRIEAALALTSEHPTQFRSSPAITPVSRYNLMESKCASPVQGAIYLNLKDRYTNGIVDRQDAPALIRSIKEFLVDAIKRELNLSVQVWTCEEVSDLGPELMVYVDGVEFTNSSMCPAVDRKNVPASCHTDTGFVLFADDSLWQSSEISPLGLHHLIAGVVNA